MVEKKVVKTDIIAIARTLAKMKIQLAILKKIKKLNG
jgi:hypothetical protein